MRNFLKDILGINKDIKKILMLSIFFLVIAGVYFYNNSYYVVVRFDELGPVSKNMPVFYNGFKVGKIVQIEPDDDFKHTLVRVNLITKNLKLPQNTTVQLKSFPSGELYLQFIYPQAPSLKTMRRGELLEGISPYSLEEFMLGQNISGVTDMVSIHVIKALDATAIANLEMKLFFQNTSQIIQDNRKSIKASINNTNAMTKSLAESAEILHQASKKINKAIDTQVLRDSTLNVRDSTSNIKNSTQNIKEATDNISKATKDIDKTIKKIDDTISQANSTAANLNCITGGLNETLSKKFGGMRIIFGTPVKPKP